MATVTTNSVTDNLSPPSSPAIARDVTNGRLYCMVQSATNTLSVYRSIDSGASWSFVSSFTQTGLQEWSSIIVDKVGYLHMAYRVGTVTADTLWYRRLNLSNFTWSGGLQVSGGGDNGGVIGSRWTGGVELAVVRHSNGTYAIVVGGAYHDGAGKYGIYVHGVSINEDREIYLNNPIVKNRRYWIDTGSAGHTGIAMDLEHTGDGITGGPPNIWIAWGRTSLRMVKLAWAGTYHGWNAPSSSITIKSSMSAMEHLAGRWTTEGFWTMAVLDPDDTTAVRLYRRNQANSTTHTYDSPSHPQGVIRYIAVSFDNVTRNTRVYAVGTATNVLYYVDFVRLTSTWSSWSTVTATAVLNSGAEWSVRRGGTYGNARFDVVTAHSGAPNTVVHTAQATSTAPNTPTWNTDGQPYLNGGAANVNAALTLAWVFSDLDLGATQGSYALSRQIGAGALSYWNAGSSTWGGSEVQNAAATQSVTLASGWASGADAAYSYKVKVWDNAGVASPGYSAAMVLTPSVQVNPTVTAPTAAQVITTNTLTVSWTVAEQTAYRIVLATNPGAAVVYDSGKVMGTATSVALPYTLPNTTGWTVTLYTYNAEGLISAGQSRNFTVAYSPPPSVTSTLTPSTTLGVVTVTPSALAVVGAQPALLNASLYRRTNTTPVLNTNPDFAGNTTGWFVGGGGTAGTLSYSTTQFRSSPGAARFVPAVSGGPVSPQVEQLAFVDIVPGSLYHASGWIRPDTAAKPIFVALNWYNASNVLVSSTIAAIASPIATAWQHLEVVGDPGSIATATKVRVAIGEQSTPATADGFYADDVRLRVHNPGEGVRIVDAGPVSAAYADWGAPASTDLEYRWISVGVNGAVQIGPWAS